MSGPMLVFGAGGQVGRELMGLAAVRGIDAVGLMRAEADITDAAGVTETMLRVKPRLIVNCAAYTAVDRAEVERETAAAINVDGAAVLARAASDFGVPIVHLSTDYVFDGRKTGAYRETDPIRPLGVYGRTKAEGEARVRLAPHHVILRTSWVYGIHGGNFLKTMLRLTAERDRLRVVADQRGCPTATRDIAEAILAVDRGMALDPAVSGTFHFAGSGATTWYAFAQAIVAAQATYTGRSLPVDPIGTADYPTPAQRPENSELDSSLFAETFDYCAEAWPIRLQEVVKFLLLNDGRIQ